MTIGQSWHRTTPRELRDKLTRLMDADPSNSVWDQPLSVSGDMEGTVYDVRVEDVTDSCDGSCDHPDCAAADEGSDLTDEGLHYSVVLWANWHGR